MILSFSVYSFNCDDKIKSYGLACKTNEYGLLDCNNKYNSYRFVPAIPAAVILSEELLPPIIGAMAGGAATLGLASSANKKSCPPCNPPVGEKFGIQVRKDHDHGNCLGKTGSMTHWHYYEMEQNPNTCYCFKSPKRTLCGTPN